ncbi:MAG: hypothetical protein KKB20_29245 [Proteobacteria bacterium]|nr:hypothetical protein [Pseudomonadota bacterium]
MLSEAVLVFIVLFPTALVLLELVYYFRDRGGYRPFDYRRRLKQKIRAYVDRELARFFQEVEAKRIEDQKRVRERIPNFDGLEDRPPEEKQRILEAYFRSQDWKNVVEEWKQDYEVEPSKTPIWAYLNNPFGFALVFVLGLAASLVVILLIAYGLRLLAG